MAQFMDNVLLWVISLAVLIIFLVFVARTLTWGSEYDPDQVACAEQIKANAKLSGWTGGKAAGAISCPTKNIVAEGSDERVKHVLAQDMVDCYELWGSGELVLFDDNLIYCHVCSLIQFEDDEPLTGFSQFLATQPERQPYLNQLTPGYHEEMFAEATPDHDEVIDRGQTYAIIFFYARGENFLDKTVDSFVGSGGGYLVGTTFLKAGGRAALGLVCLGSGVCAVGVTAASVISGAVMGSVFPETPDYASFVVLRPWTPETVADLGCQAVFAE